MEEILYAKWNLFLGAFKNNIASQEGNKARLLHVTMSLGM